MADTLIRILALLLLASCARSTVIEPEPEQEHIDAWLVLPVDTSPCREQALASWSGRTHLFCTTQNGLYRLGSFAERGEPQWLPSEELLVSSDGYPFLAVRTLDDGQQVLLANQRLTSTTVAGVGWRPGHEAVLLSESPFYIFAGASGIGVQVLGGGDTFLLDAQFLNRRLQDGGACGQDCTSWLPELRTWGVAITETSDGVYKGAGVVSLTEVALVECERTDTSFRCSVGPPIEVPGLRYPASIARYGDGYLVPVEGDRMAYLSTELALVDVQALPRYINDHMPTGTGERLSALTSINGHGAIVSFETPNERNAIPIYYIGPEVDRFNLTNIVLEADGTGFCTTDGEQTWFYHAPRP